jgi:hypothetical protein
MMGRNESTFGFGAGSCCGSILLSLKHCFVQEMQTLFAGSNRCPSFLICSDVFSFRLGKKNRQR